jgi:hypothetical protein
MVEKAREGIYLICKTCSSYWPCRCSPNGRCLPCSKCESAGHTIVAATAETKAKLYWRDREEIDDAAQPKIPVLFLDPVPENVRCESCGREPFEGEVYGVFPEHWDQVRGLCAECSEESIH